MLMQHGATIEHAGASLLTAIKENRDEVAEWLIAEGGDLNVMGRITFKIETAEEAQPGQPIPSRRPGEEPVREWGNCNVTPLAAE